MNLATGAICGGAVGYILGGRNPGAAVDGALWGGLVGVSVSLTERIRRVAITDIVEGAIYGSVTGFILGRGSPVTAVTGAIFGMGIGASVNLIKRMRLVTTESIVGGAICGSVAGYLLGLGNPGGAVTGAIWGGAVGASVSLVKRIHPVAIGAILGGAAGAVLVGVPLTSSLVIIYCFTTTHCIQSINTTASVFTVIGSEIPATIGAIVGAAIAKISNIAARERIRENALQMIESQDV